MDDPNEFRRLMTGLREGDQAAGDELCRRFGPFVRAAVRRRLHDDLRTRFDSLDFVQDVWVSFLAVPAARLSFDTPEALVAYLTRVAQNKVVDSFRRRFDTAKDAIARERPIAEARDGAGTPTAAGGSPSQWAVAGEEWERLLAAVPADHRSIVERLRDGYTQADIARMTGVGLRTVERVVKRLKELTDS